MERFNDIYRIVQPMKYAVAKKPEILKEALVSEDYGLQLKKDGASYVWARDLDGSVHLYGDKISKKTGEVIDKIENLPHLIPFAETYFPLGSQICVEVIYDYSWTNTIFTKELRSSSKYVNSIMLCNPEKAAARQLRTKPCEIYVFDILFWNQEPFWDKDFEERYKKICELAKSVFIPETDSRPSWLEFAETFFTDKEERLGDWLSSGEEGGVLKLLKSKGRISAKHAISEIGSTAKRPMHTTYKIKQIDTTDAIIIGINHPTKEYTGKDPENYPFRDKDNNPVNRLWALNFANGFSIGLYNDKNELVKIGDVASGLDDELRQDLINNPDGYIGSVVEISCMSIDKKAHTLRHPRLMCFRPDKAAEDCTIKDVFGEGD